MKITKFISSIFTRQQNINKLEHNIPVPPIIYDRSNVTAEEFRKYIHYLAENKINKIVYEPDRFVTEAEREAAKKKYEEVGRYREFVKNLAEAKTNYTFFC